MIGNFELELPNGHNLAEIYKNKPEYQFTPWKHIASILAKNGLDIPLLDIGANIGDSAAHYRSHCSSEIIRLEADPTFFSYLEKNSKTLGNVKNVAALVVKNSKKNYKFMKGNQTGHIAASREKAEIYQGLKLEMSDVLNLNKNEPCVLKTDCDGYDEVLIGEAIKLIDGKQEFPVIFTEGPSENQMKKGKWKKYNRLIRELIKRDYIVHIYSNHGEIFTSTTSPKTVKNYFKELQKGLRVRKGMCHYFDFIFEKLN